MLVIGIAGGVACGKSLVAGQFGELGATVLDADKTGHEVLRLEIVKEAIRNEFGDSVFAADGEVDRGLMAAVVFDSDDESALKRLETITHPVIRRRMLERLNELANDGLTRAVVLDVPLLFESGYDRLCDRIVFVDVPLTVRVSRAMQSRGWDEHEIERRESRQIPLAEKMQRSDERIDNSESSANTFKQVRALWLQWGLDVDPAITGENSGSSSPVSGK